MFQVLRLPGNLLHELAHAVALLACGFTVVGFSVALFDPAGRGEVRPGPPWTRFASVWAASFLSPIAPVFVGVPTLALLFHLSGAPGLPTALEAVAPTLRAMPWTHATFWIAMLLAVPVSAEMAPSDVDLRAWRTPGTSPRPPGSRPARGPSIQRERGNSTSRSPPPAIASATRSRRCWTIRASTIGGTRWRRPW
jgi:hypothetical protein